MRRHLRPPCSVDPYVDGTASVQPTPYHLVMARTHVAVVPHTHWDREWYLPFQAFRMSLVETLDALLDLMEADPSYERFLLDGQMAVVDDYLEIRPESEDRLAKLIVEGRITVGPWYIQMDQFLVSGETIWRNLQLGLKKAEPYGGAMEVGYLPDMFGHIAQMPQILAQAGLRDAVLWRGVPSSVTSTGFDWASPDGSQVRVEYLPLGYSNGALLPATAEGLLRRVTDHHKELEPLLAGDLLMMNGSDHLAPQPHLSQLIADANAIQDELAFTITSLPEYLTSVPRDNLERIEGELRSGARANLLMGVASNRVDVKRAAAITERNLERRAEPLAALVLGTEDYPHALLDLAWLQMIYNSAHDSICACSVDEVVDAVVARYAEARQIAEGVADRGLATLATSMAHAGPVVVNLSQRSRSGVLELALIGDDLALDRVQVLSEQTGLPGYIVLDAATVTTVLGLLQGPKIDNDTFVEDLALREDDEGIHLTVTIGTREVPNIPIAETKAELSARLGARPDAMVHVNLDQPTIRRVLARSAEVPGFGWRSFEATPLRNPALADPRAARIENGLVSVEVDRSDGSFAINGVPGFGRLCDGGDLGDSYNYSPPASDQIIDTPVEVTVTITEEGPVRSSIEIASCYRIPEFIDGGSQRRVGEVELRVITTVSVEAESPVVHVSSSFVNPARDHRLRVMLPLVRPATSSDAECSFTVVTRGLEAEGRADEFGLPTFPSRRFVRAGGLTVVHEGLCEYELADIHENGAETLALTALRSTGMLSRLGMALRPFPAGPLTPVDGLQLVGRRITARYGICLEDVDPYAMVDEVLLPLEVTHSLGGGHRGPSGALLAIRGAEVSAVHRVEGELEIRIYNPSASTSIVDLDGRSGTFVDLRGETIATFDGSFELGPHKIATVRLVEEAPSLA